MRSGHLTHVLFPEDGGVKLSDSPLGLGEPRFLRLLEDGVREPSRYPEVQDGYSGRGVSPRRDSRTSPIVQSRRSERSMSAFLTDGATRMVMVTSSFPVARVGRRPGPVRPRRIGVESKGVVMLS